MGDVAGEMCQRIAAARDDRDALGELLESYRPYLNLLARVQIGRRLGRKADHADVVQETFLEASGHFAGFQGSTEPALLAWLRSILATRLADLIRRYQGTQARDVRLEAELGYDLGNSSAALGRVVIDPCTSPSSAAGRREQCVRVATAIASLPVDYREVVVLRQFEELSFPDVADRMGRSVDSVQKLWVRALVQLRRTLAAEP